jgi:NAD(P)-dependent dehydrogenase (short-subunit alcohol dehydrogenase family)
MSEAKVALVTGASRGIGRGIALRLAREGYTVVLNSRTADPTNLQKGLYEVRRTIAEAGGKAEVFRADISSSQERDSLVEFLERQFPRLELLVNNAGIEPEPLDLLQAGEERLERVLAVNLKGPYFLTQALARRMIRLREQGRVEVPRIVFITSVQAYMANPTGAEYCLSKAALHMAVKAFAARLGPSGIPVFEISPGIIESDMSRVHKANIDRMIASGRLPTARWGQPEEVAALVAAIARGELDYSTGSTIEVGGGLGLQRL